MGWRAEALITFEKWLASSNWFTDRLEFQREFEGLFQQGTGRDFDDCLGHLSEGARKSVEACMLEFYFSRRPVNDILREFTVEGSQDLSYSQMMYLLALGHTKASIYEVAQATPGAGLVLTDRIRAGQRFRIPQDLASDVLSKGDRVLTRVVKNKIGIQLSGGTLVIPPQLWPHLSEKISGPLTAGGYQNPPTEDLCDEVAEELTWYTISCWVNAYSGPGAPPPKLLDFDRD